MIFCKHSLTLLWYVVLQLVPTRHFYYDNNPFLLRSYVSHLKQCCFLPLATAEGGPKRDKTCSVFAMPTFFTEMNFFAYIIIIIINLAGNTFFVSRLLEEKISSKNTMVVDSGKLLSLLNLVNSNIPYSVCSWSS